VGMDTGAGGGASVRQAVRACGGIRPRPGAHPAAGGRAGVRADVNPARLDDARLDDGAPTSAETLRRPTPSRTGPPIWDGAEKKAPLQATHVVTNIGIARGAGDGIGRIGA
jgi:hypothetical protein